MQEKKEIFIFGDFGKRSIWIGLTSIVIFAIVMLVIFGTERFKKPAELKKEPLDTFGYPETLFKQLADYIKNGINAGHDAEAIKKRLIETGHDLSKVEKIMEHVLKSK